jgi:hypothetical protein
MLLENIMTYLKNETFTIIITVQEVPHEPLMVFRVCVFGWLELF